MITQLHGWEATEPPPWRWCVWSVALGRSHAMAMGSARLVRIGADCKGRIGENFFAFFTKGASSSYRLIGMVHLIQTTSGIIQLIDTTCSFTSNNVRMTDWRMTFNGPIARLNGRWFSVHGSADSGRIETRWELDTVAVNHWLSTLR